MQSNLEFSFALMTDSYTVFEYLYRDAGNYKAWGSLLLAGTVTAEMETAFRELLDSGEFFVAEQVGVPRLDRELWKLSGGPTEDDHGFHEFHGFRSATGEDLKEPVWGSVEGFFAAFGKALDAPIFTSL